MALEMAQKAPHVDGRTPVAHDGLQHVARVDHLAGERILGHLLDQVVD